MDWVIIGCALAVLVATIIYVARAIVIPGVVCADGLLPVVGHLIKVQKEIPRYFDWQVDQFQKFGSSFQIAVPGAPPTVCTISPDNVKYMLKDNFDNFEKGWEFQSIFDELLGDGIFAVDGEPWRLQRKAASHLFGTRSLRDVMSHVFTWHCHEVIRKLHQQYRNGKNLMSVPGADKKTEGVLMDVDRVMFAFTLDCFGEIAFSAELNELDLALDRQPERSADVKEEKRFGWHFDRAQEILTYRFFNPLYPVARFLNYGWEGQLKGHIKFVKKFCKDIVQSRMAEFKEAEAERVASSLPRRRSRNIHRDLLEMFLEREDEENPYSERWLTTILINFFVAGRDTTACLLSWALWRLSVIENKHILERLRNDMDQVLKEDEGRATDHRWPHAATSDSEDDSEVEDFTVFSYEQIQRLPYAYQIIMETLRLHPSVPSDGKTSVKPCTLPDGTSIPAGASVYFVPYAMGRREDLWGDDAHVFNPDRFEGKQHKVDQFKFSAFNAGPRLCLGRSMALLEAQLVLCSLLYHFTPHQAAPQTEVPAYKLNITLQPKERLNLIFVPRNQN